MLLIIMIINNNNNNNNIKKFKFAHLEDIQIETYRIEICR